MVIRRDANRAMWSASGPENSAPFGIGIDRFLLPFPAVCVIMAFSLFDHLCIHSFEQVRKARKLTTSGLSAFYRKTFPGSAKFALNPNFAFFPGPSEGSHLPHHPTHIHPPIPTHQIPGTQVPGYTDCHMWFIIFEFWTKECGYPHPDFLPHFSGFLTRTPAFREYYVPGGKPNGK